MGNVISSFMNGTGNTLRELGVYLLGRGLMTSMALGIGFMGAGLSTAGLVAVLGAGVAFGGYMSLRGMRNNQDRMADLYRGEIANQLGMDAKDVTRQHVHLLAFGDRERGIKPNPILKEEVTREWNKAMLGFGTSLLAAAASFALVSLGWAGWATDLIAQGTPVPEWVLGTGVGIVSAASSLVLNNGLDLTLKSVTSLGKTTLHDRIASLDRAVARGRQVSAQQVFSLFVAADATLGASIEKRLGKSFEQLSEKAKIGVMEQVGATAQMVAIAEDVNAKRISVGSLAFVLSGQSAPSKTPARNRQETEEAPARSQTRFGDRVGKQAQMEMSFAEREDARRGESLVVSR